MVSLVRQSLGGNKLVLGVDRLDYSKGIPERIKGVRALSRNQPGVARQRVTLLQLTPKSRSDIKQYGDIESEVTGLIGKVNGHFGDAAWTPIRYVNRSYSRTVLAGLYRAADVAMVTPLRDGMNLGRQGISRRSGSRRSRRAGAVAIRRRGERARPAR